MWQIAFLIYFYSNSCTPIGPKINSTYGRHMKWITHDKEIPLDHRYKMKGLKHNTQVFSFQKGRPLTWMLRKTNSIPSITV